MAYQSIIVIVLALGSFAVGLIAGNESALGINQPWLTLVVIPTVLTGFTLAANQLKSIGAQATNTVTETKVTTTTPPAAPPIP